MRRGRRRVCTLIPLKRITSRYSLVRSTSFSLSICVRVNVPVMLLAFSPRLSLHISGQFINLPSFVCMYCFRIMPYLVPRKRQALGRFPSTKHVVICMLAWETSAGSEHTAGSWPTCMRPGCSKRRSHACADAKASRIRVQR